MTMNRYLAKLASGHQRDWDCSLHPLLFSYLSGVHDSTAQTLATIVLGRELRLPSKPEYDVTGKDYVAYPAAYHTIQ